MKKSIVNESYNIGDLVHIIYKDAPIPLGIWVGSEKLSNHGASFAKIFQLGVKETVYFTENDDNTYSSKLASPTSKRAKGINA